VIVRAEFDVVNWGPTSPVDAVVDLSASAPSGVSVTPSNPSVSVPGLQVGAVLDFARDFEITCSSVGKKVVTFGGSITSTDGSVDPTPANDDRTAALELSCVKAKK
jgi:hypothetical protein